MLSIALTLALASTGPQTAAQCEAVFGDEATRLDLEADKRPRVVDVVETRDGRAVLHAVPRWKKPKALRVSGIQLLRIEDPGDERPAWQRRVAHVRLSDPRCPEGEYTLTVGAALGPKLRVVAVLDDSVLLEKGHSLVRLGNGRDDLRMVWQSDFAITVAGGGGGGSGSTAKSAARAPAKSSDAPKADPARASNAKAAADRLAERKERAKARAARKADN